MFNQNDLIDDKYIVTGTCNDSGGMGMVLLVRDKASNPDNYEQFALKYCRDDDPEWLHRFRREVRFLNEFRGNPRVVQVLDSNLDYVPPYFVMKFYPDGDIRHLHDRLKNDINFQEKLFNQMIDCINELHIQKKYHRDIKPQNFLSDGNDILVSDFGLSMEYDSSTAVTKSSANWGTRGYIPPEFYEKDGFHNVEAPADIFMLGKSFYSLLTGQDNPVYLTKNVISEPLYLIIQRCCELEKDKRYQTLAELRQNLEIAFDVLLDRKAGSSRAIQLFNTINQQVENTNTFDAKEVLDFVDSLAMIPEREWRGKLCFDFRRPLFEIFNDESVQSGLRRLLEIYKEMVEDGNYGFSFAEVIATNMKAVFDGQAVSNEDKAFALEIAIIGAQLQSRFAAMDTCNEMINSVTDENLAIRIREVLIKHKEKFVRYTEPWQSKADLIQKTLSEIRPKDESDN